MNGSHVARGSGGRYKPCLELLLQLGTCRQFHEIRLDHLSTLSALSTSSSPRLGVLPHSAQPQQTPTAGNRSHIAGRVQQLSIVFALTCLINPEEGLTAVQHNHTTFAGRSCCKGRRQDPHHLRAHHAIQLSQQGDGSRLKLAGQHAQPSAERRGSPEDEPRRGGAAVPAGHIIAVSMSLALQKLHEKLRSHVPPAL